MSTYPRKATDGRERVQCTCGHLVAKRAMTGHRRGTLHLYSRRVSALLEQDCVSSAEIGRRLGITRERVAQISVMLGYGRRGNKRRTVCALNQLPEATEKFIRADPLLSAAIDAVRQKGMQASAVTHPQSCTTYPVLKRTIEVNGRRCFLGKSIVDERRIIRVWANTREGIDAALYQLTDGRWMIIPAKDLPRQSTMFREGATPRKGAHNWHQYIEAWHLLA